MSLPELSEAAVAVGRARRGDLMRELAGGHHAAGPRLPILERRGDGRGFGREREDKGQRRGPMKGRKWVWRGRTSENSEVLASPSSLRPY